MSGNKKNDYTGVIIAVLVIVVVVLFLLLNKANNAQFDNTGKNYKDAVFKTQGDCERVIMGTIEQYGDDRGYYCYKVTDTYGKTVWKTGNIYDK